MRPVLIVTHLEDHDTGVVREQLERAGCAVVQASALEDPALPPLSEISAIVSLGGVMSATQYRLNPFLAAEVELMQQALEVQAPVLGMCLGAQLLAVAAGGRVSRLGSMYVGWPPLSLLPAAQDDPLFGDLTGGLPVLKWHEDVIEAPPGSVVLGTTTGPGADLLRIAPRAWASQMHLEVTPAMLLDGWLAQSSGVAEVQAAGHEIDAFRARSRERLPIQMAAARPVFSAFARLARHPEAAGR